MGKSKTINGRADTLADARDLIDQGQKILTKAYAHILGDRVGKAFKDDVWQGHYVYVTGYDAQTCVVTAHEIWADPIGANPETISGGLNRTFTAKELLQFREVPLKEFWFFWGKLADAVQSASAVVNNKHDK